MSQAKDQPPLQPQPAVKKPLLNQLYKSQDKFEDATQPDFVVKHNLDDSGNQAVAKNNKLAESQVSLNSINPDTECSDEFD